MATKKITVEVPPSTTKQTVTIDVNVTDPVISIGTPVITGGAPVPPPVEPPPVDPPPTTERKHILFEEMFDGNWIPGVNSGNAKWYEQAAASRAKSYSIQAATDIVKRGSGSVRFELRPVDATGQSDTSCRSELSLKLSDNVYCERWIGFSVYLKDWGADSADDLIHQIHSPNGQSPCFAIITRSGKWHVSINVDRPDGSINYQTIDTGVKCEVNEWVDFVVHLKMSAGTDGFVEVFKNGIKFWSRYNFKTQYSQSKLTGNSNLYRIGVYKWPWNNGKPSQQSVRIAYYDSLRVGDELATYKDVAP